MTSEGSEEPEATTEPSEMSSGEERRDDPRDAEEPKATTGVSEMSSGDERSDDPRDSDTPEEPATSDGATSDGGDESSSNDSDERTPDDTDESTPDDTDESTPDDTDEPTPDDSDEPTPDDSDEPTSDDTDDVPLTIAGHEDREPPASAAESGSIAFDDESVTADEPLVEGVDDLDARSDGEDEDVQPVELLVQLAKNGEIDPWDIDIVRVTDKFLEALDEADLRTSGRALFYASVLLRMKSDALFAVDEPDDEELAPWEAPFADADHEEPAGPAFDPVDQLEAEMERRLERQQARGKPETLDELVRELRDAERGSWWKRSRSYDTSGSPRGFNRGVQELSYHSGDAYRGVDEPTADDVTHTQHDEDIEDVIDDVEAALDPHYEEGRDEVLFAEVEGAGGSRVMTYLALLFLAHRGRIQLEQDELFGDLWIQRATVEAEPAEAVAD